MRRTARGSSRRRFLAGIGAAGWLLAGPRAARAQAYPTRPIRLILGFPPGGGTDALARLLAPALAEKLGQQVFVDNKTGANGNLATEFVARAQPDGHTLLVSTSSAIVAAPHAFQAMPVNTIDDLAHIGMCAESAFCIMTNPGLPAKTLEDFVAAAKASPGKLIHASPGLGGVNHIGGELFAIRTGINLKTVQYRGSGPIMTDLLADQVNMTVGSVGLAEPYVSAGRLNAILVMSKNRTSHLPNVPCSGELGIKDLDQVTFWSGLHGPKATPPEVLDRLSAALNDVLNDAPVQQRLAATGLRPVGGNREDFVKRLRSDLVLYGEIFRAAKIQPE